MISILMQGRGTMVVCIERGAMVVVCIEREDIFSLIINWLTRKWLPDWNVFPTDLSS